MVSSIENLGWNRDSAQARRAECKHKRHLKENSGKPLKQKRTWKGEENIRQHMTLWMNWPMIVLQTYLIESRAYRHLKELNPPACSLTARTVAPKSSERPDPAPHWAILSALSRRGLTRTEAKSWETRASEAMDETAEARKRTSVFQEEKLKLERARAEREERREIMEAEFRREELDLRRQEMEGGGRGDRELRERVQGLEGKLISMENTLSKLANHLLPKD